MTTPKRYDLVTNYRAGSSIEEMERSDDGEWVRWESVQELLAEAERAREEWKNLALSEKAVARLSEENARLRDTLAEPTRKMLVRVLGVTDCEPVTQTPYTMVELIRIVDDRLPDALRGERGTE